MENKEHKKYEYSEQHSKRLYGLRGLKKLTRDVASTVLLKALSTVLKIGGSPTEYETVDDGDRVGIQWKESGLNLCCCDCGLVHYIDIEVEHDIVWLTFMRNEEETERARTRKGVAFKEVPCERDGD